MSERKMIDSRETDLYWPRSAVSKCTDCMTFNLFAQFPQHVYLLRPSFADRCHTHTHSPGNDSQHSHLPRYNNTRDTGTTVIGFPTTGIPITGDMSEIQGEFVEFWTTHWLSQTIELLIFFNRFSSSSCSHCHAIVKYQCYTDNK